MAAIKKLMERIDTDTLHFSCYLGYPSGRAVAAGD